MFCGELNGGLIAAHKSLRADEVRANIAVMTSPGYPVKIGWAKAKKDGWRVVPVQVAKRHLDVVPQDTLWWMAADEIENLTEMLRLCEISLGTMDEVCSSEYWERYPGNPIHE